MDRLNAALRIAVGSDNLKQRMEDLGSIPATDEELSPQYVRELVRGDIARFRKLLAAAK